MEREHDCLERLSVRFRTKPMRGDSILVKMAGFTRYFGELAAWTFYFYDTKFELGVN